MSYDDHKLQEVDQDDHFFNMKNGLSRNSSVGCSSRIYYCRSAGTGGIPFDWEMEPGTPKDPPKEEALPPLSPPPAVLSLGLPKPSITAQLHHHQDQPCKPSRRRVIVRFWKKNKKRNSNNNNEVISNNGGGGGGAISHIDYKDERFEFCNSDSEFMASPARDSSSSSSSSSLSFSRQSSRLQSPAWHSPMNGSRANLSCSPWSIRSILVTLAKRV
ncbi:uncharacterized protein LOC133784455 [Humulus lupulus]|uniref:uncharacterized protein LOC133784455 n=1 Tax=Humulus lupulus TaxID=3486 RepID=UPI002B4049CE|nr:uncharacterized protein LOC133784455 [Humulus lupulus]